MALLQYHSPVNYKAQLEAFRDFLQNFKSPEAYSEDIATDAIDGLHIDSNGISDDYDLMDDAEEDFAMQKKGQGKASQGKRKYMTLLQEVADRVRSDVLIDLDDLDSYERSLENKRKLKLVESITINAKRYLDVFSEAVDKVMPKETKEISFKDDVVDVVVSQREKRNETMSQVKEMEIDTAAPDSTFPAELTRRYYLSFRPMTPSGSSDDFSSKALAVRNIRGEHLGRLITVRAITTRVSDVKPVLQINAFACDLCGCEVFQPVTSKQFSPLQVCPSPECQKNNTKGLLVPCSRASKYLPFQEIKVQEMADQVPIGHIPRMLTVHCYGGLTRQLNPGDVVDVAGIFLPVPYTGFRAMKSGLLTDTFLEAQHIIQHKAAYQDMLMDAKTLRRIDEHKASKHMYQNLAKSIAPEIFGHLDVKKALLLLLVGGVTKEMGDGMRIRGDINLCLMGDPGVAKSQLLKYIAKVAPRGVYTTGRGSSGVGLTAAVMRDPMTDEMVLEGGALVLADNGICCIDEFDKMDDGDRTAIHEVMEQQTISISKAGITTTLNARTSILAAANPVYGRYNPRISPVQNINLPAALLSRFDVMFLILDTPSRDSDAKLANHVAYVHMNSRHPGADTGGVIFSPDEVKQYVAQARSYRPTVPKPVSEYMVAAYVKMRQEQKRDEVSKKAFTHTSPRTLLGVLRLSQALARLRFSDQVANEDVDEALRLVEVSKASLYSESRAHGYRSTNSKIYDLVRGLKESGAAAVGDGSRGGELSIRKITERVIASGYTQDQFQEAIQEFEASDLWQRAANGTRLVFVETGDLNDEMDI